MMATKQVIFLNVCDPSTYGLTRAKDSYGSFVHRVGGISEEAL